MTRQVCVVSLYKKHIQACEQLFKDMPINIGYMKLNSADHDDLKNFYGAKKILLIATYTQRGYIVPRVLNDMEDSQLGRVFREALQCEAELFMLLAYYKNEVTSESGLYCHSLGSFLANQPSIKQLAEKGRFISVGQIDNKICLEIQQEKALMKWMTHEKNRKVEEATQFQRKRGDREDSHDSHYSNDRFEMDESGTPSDDKLVSQEKPASRIEKVDKVKSQERKTTDDSDVHKTQIQVASPEEKLQSDLQYNAEQLEKCSRSDNKTILRERMKIEEQQCTLPTDGQKQQMIATSPDKKLMSSSS